MHEVVAVGDPRVRRVGKHGVHLLRCALPDLHGLHDLREGLIAGLLLPLLPLLAGAAGLPKALAVAVAGPWGASQVGRFLLDDLLLLLAVAECWQTSVRGRGRGRGRGHRGGRSGGCGGRVSGSGGGVGSSGCDQLWLLALQQAKNKY